MTETPKDNARASATYAAIMMIVIVACSILVTVTFIIGASYAQHRYQLRQKKRRATSYVARNRSARDLKDDYYININNTSEFQPPDEPESPVKTSPKQKKKKTNNWTTTTPNCEVFEKENERRPNMAMAYDNPIYTGNNFSSEKDQAIILNALNVQIKNC